MAKKIKRDMADVDMEFKRFVKEIQIRRIQVGIDKPNKVIGTKRLSRGMVTHPLAKNIAKDLIKMPRKEDLR